MGRILAIDYGKKRTGLAMTDALQIAANPLVTVETSTIWAFLDNLSRTEPIEKIIVGYPRQMDNTLSESVEHIDPFVSFLRRRYPQVPVELVDERFTSKLAVRSMVEGGVPRKKRQDKGMIDMISACIMLQSYMEMQSNRKEKF